MALYYPLASAANKPHKRRGFFSFDDSSLFRMGRFVGTILLGVIVLQLPGLGAQATEVGWALILGIAPVSLLVDRVTPRRSKLVSQTVFDLSIIVGGTALLPGAWVPALILGALIIGGSVPRLGVNHRGSFLAVPVAFLAAMWLVASHHNIADAWLSLLAFGVGTPFCLLYTLREQHRERTLHDRAVLIDALTRMAGGIGHDFNNLLTGIQGNAELAELKLDPNHVARPYLQALLSESQKAQLFSAQLLAFSGGVATGRERLAVRSELSGLVGLLESALPRGVQLKLHAEDHLPLVSVNRAQLQEIVVAGVLYVADSIRVAPAEVTLTMRKVTRRYTDELVIQLRASSSQIDSGRNASFVVDRQNLESLRFGFDRARAVMREHDGNLEVHEGRREGRVITLRLPGLDDSPSVVSRTQAPMRIVPRHILLLESASEVREVACELLEALGHQVTAADNEASVIEAITQDSTIDVVLLDTPGPISRILLSRIDAVRPALPALLPEVARERVGEWIERPNVNYVAKPYSSADLNSAITRLFDPLRS